MQQYKYIATFIKELDKLKFDAPVTNVYNPLKYAYNLYSEALADSGMKKTASKKHELKTVKIGGNEVCAQTFLPVDKVYIDENGVSHAKYRKDMEHTSDSKVGVAMHRKILLGL